MTDQERDKIYKHIKQFMKENPEVNVEKMIAEILLDEIEKEMKLKRRTMTDQKILELVEEFFEVGGIRDDGSFSEFYTTAKDIIEFAHQIRKQTLEEVISVLQNVPNPEANRAAINRIETELNR
jgi:predicted Zn-dependent peptidase